MIQQYQLDPLIPVAEFERAALSERDLIVLRAIAERDPDNQIGVRLFGAWVNLCKSGQPLRSDVATRVVFGFLSVDTVTKHRIYSCLCSRFLIRLPRFTVRKNEGAELTDKLVRALWGGDRPK